jgi:hypothetical protein
MKKMENEKHYRVDLRSKINQLITSWIEYIQKEAVDKLYNDIMESDLRDIDKNIYKEYDSLKRILFSKASKYTKNANNNYLETEVEKYIKFAKTYIYMVTLLSVKNDDLRYYFHHSLITHMSVGRWSDQNAAIIFELYDNLNPGVLNLDNWFNFCFNLSDKELNNLPKTGINGPLALEGVILSYMNFLEKIQYATSDSFTKENKHNEVFKKNLSYFNGGKRKKRKFEKTPVPPYRQPKVTSLERLLEVADSFEKIRTGERKSLSPTGVFKKLAQRDGYSDFTLRNWLNGNIHLISERKDIGDLTREDMKLLWDKTEYRRKAKENT